MKKLMLIAWLIALVIPTLAQTDYKQWEVMYIRPKADKLDLFKKGMAAHNKKFHSTDPYKAGVASILTGPQSGSYAWYMGPTTWTQMDGRPGKGEHDMDWDKMVVPNIESSSEVTYWRADNELSYQPAGGSTTFIKSRQRNYTILPGQTDRFAAAIKMIVDVYKKKSYPVAYSVYWRQGASAGPHAIVSIDFDKWAYFDRANTVMKDFEEVHGAGSWARFLDELALSLDRTKTFDELGELVAELSGGN